METNDVVKTPCHRLQERRIRPGTSVKINNPSSRTPCHIPRVVLLYFLSVACFLGAAEANLLGESAEDLRITCYTCMNVSNNEECNRYAIDRPCPEGKDFCLILHVMDRADGERSLLVNKRCAALEDCVGDSTGCTTAYGQMQCTSCCDQPYCNDHVPSNQANAVFQRSASCHTVEAESGTTWRLAAALTSTAFSIVGTFR